MKVLINKVDGKIVKAISQIDESLNPSAEQIEEKVYDYDLINLFTMGAEIIYDFSTDDFVVKNKPLTLEEKHIKLESENAELWYQNMLLEFKLDDETSALWYEIMAMGGM